MKRIPAKAKQTPESAKATSINFGNPATQNLNVTVKGDCTFRLSPELEAVIATMIQNTSAQLAVIDKKLDVILEQEKKMVEQEKKMADTLDDVVNDVAAETDVVGSVVTLLDGINAKLTAAGNDPAKLKEIRASLAAQKQALVDAVTRNTAAEPPQPEAGQRR